MKALILTNNLGEKSGWERYSTDLIDQFIKNDIEAVVICHKKNDNYKGIKQLELLPSPLSFKKNYILSFYYFYKFNKINKNLKGFDFVHCFVEPYAFITYLISKYLNLKYFLTIHGSYGIKTFHNKIYKFLQLLSYKNAKNILCVSNYTKSRVLEYKKLGNIEVIPNGVNLKGFSAIQSGVKKENIIIGVGTLKERKGFDVMVRAISIVKKSIPDIKYYIIGSQKDKGYFNSLTSLIDELDLKNNIFFFENLSDDELKNKYQEAKIFSLTPISDKYNFEGFGLVYLEANAFGLPVIGSCDNGGEEAIKNSYNGFLTKPNDPSDIAEKIVILLKDNFLYGNISANSLLWAKKLSWNNIIKRYIKVYKNEKN